MNMPDVKHVIHDESNNITFRLWAYRKLTAKEQRHHTAQCIARMKTKPKRNTSYDFVTTIGIGGT